MIGQSIIFTRQLLIAAVTALVFATVAGAGALELLMFEQPGCIYCARWNAEIAPKYDRSAEGKAAPLRRVQLHGPLPDGVSVDRPASFTPTFVLLADGTEVGRIEGYPGEDFFWPLLQRLIDQAAAAD